MLGKAQAQRIALGIEYNWDPESKFVRAALADSYLPDFQGYDWKIISVGGTAESWELKTLVSKPQSLLEVAEQTKKQIVSKTPHTTSPVVLKPLKTANDFQWQFTDDQGRKWLGSGNVEPSTDEKEKFVLTLQLARRR